MCGRARNVLVLIGAAACAFAQELRVPAGQVVFSLGEPVDVVAVLENHGADAIRVQYDDDRSEFTWTVHDPLGKVREYRHDLTMNPLPDWGTFVGRTKLVPGESLERYVPLSARTKFGLVGTYFVRLRFEATGAETSLVVVILPRDEQRLQKRCSELAEQAVDDSDVTRSSYASRVLIWSQYSKTAACMAIPATPTSRPDPQHSPSR